MCVFVCVFVRERLSLSLSLSLSVMYTGICYMCTLLCRYPPLHMTCMDPPPHMCKSLCMYINTYVHTYIHTYKYTYIYIHTYIMCTYIHIPPRRTAKDTPCNCSSYSLALLLSRTPPFINVFPLDTPCNCSSYSLALPSVTSLPS